MIDIIKVILLGIIQGITEWLPISSTGHMLLFNELWPLLPEEFFNVFLVVIQFGSILAILLLYWNRLNPWSKKKSEKQKNATFNLWGKVIVACLPAAIVGVLLDEVIENFFSGSWIIAIMLILYGVIFILQAQFHMIPKIRKINEITYKDAFKIGCFQVLALIPGTSRSGATILGGLYEGLSRPVASEFSFFIAIPVMAGASALRLLKYLINYGMFSLFQTFLLLLGTFVAFVVSLFAVKFMISYVRKHSFAAFGWYRIALGVIILVSTLFIH